MQGKVKCKYSKCKNEISKSESKKVMIPYTNRHSKHREWKSLHFCSDECKIFWDRLERKENER